MSEKRFGLYTVERVRMNELCQQRSGAAADVTRPQISTGAMPHSAAMPVNVRHLNKLFVRKVVFTGTGLV